MTAIQLSIAVQSILSLIVLAFIVCKLWPEQRVDLFRQQMFALRDELFDFAADGKVGFEEPAYRQLRALMNGLIRYAHNITPFRTLLAYLRWKTLTLQERDRQWAIAWQRAVNNVENPETRKSLEEFHSRATMLVMSQLVLSPGVLVTLLPFLAVFAILYAPWATLRDIYLSVKAKIPIALLEQEATNTF